MNDAPRRNYDWASVVSDVSGRTLGGPLLAWAPPRATIDLGGLPVTGLVSSALRRDDGAPSMLPANVIPKVRR